MSTIIFLFLSGLFCSFSIAAQGSEAARLSKLTDPVYIAMIYHKVTEMRPDFRSWVKLTKEYQDADFFKKDEIMTRRVSDLVNTFGLVSESEVITLNTTVSLSPYNSITSGFLISAFKSDMMLPVEYADEHFGLIPEHLADLRWLKVPEDMAKEIWRRTDNGKKAYVEFQLSASGVIEGVEPSERHGMIFWPPLVMKVEAFRVWSADKTEMLWEYRPSNTLADKLRSLFYQGRW